MTRALYVVGPPGVGKTTLMRMLKAEWLEGPPHQAWPKSLVWVTPLFAPDRLVGLEIGRQRDAFGGTDALGMAVMPQALHWVGVARFPEVVLGEGARLGTAIFLGALGKRTDLTVVHLVAEEATLAERRAARGSKQDPTWMRGAATRAANTAQRLRDDYPRVRVIELDATSATPFELRSRCHEEALR